MEIEKYKAKTIIKGGNQERGVWMVEILTERGNREIHGEKGVRERQRRSISVK